MNSRIVFGVELCYAMQVRGLSLTGLADLAGVAIATASSAATGRPVNVTTALRIARAVAARPVIPELVDWVERPKSGELGPLAAERASPTIVERHAVEPDSRRTVRLASPPRFDGRRRARVLAGDQLPLTMD